MAGVENAGPDNPGTDLQGWKTRELTTRKPNAGVENAEPDNVRTNCKCGKLLGFKLECLKTCKRKD